MKVADMPDRIVLFDGVCNFCDGAVQFIIKHDPEGLFSFASLQSDAGGNLLKQYHLPSGHFDSKVSAGTAVMKNAEGYKQVPYKRIQGWGQGLALTFLADVLRTKKRVYQ